MSAVLITICAGDEYRGHLWQYRDVTNRKRAEREVIERARQASLGADVGCAVTKSGTLREILQWSAEAIVRHLDVTLARIWTPDQQEDKLELQASAGMNAYLDDDHARTPVGELEIGLIAQQRRPLLINDLTQDPGMCDRERAGCEGIVVFAGYPLLVEGRLVGVMAVFTAEAPTEAASDALASVAHKIALGIERKWAEEQTSLQHGPHISAVTVVRNWGTRRAIHRRHRSVNPRPS